MPSFIWLCYTGYEWRGWRLIAFARGAEEQMYLQITRKSNYRRDKILMADRSIERSIATARLLLDGCAFAKIDDWCRDWFDLFLWKQDHRVSGIISVNKKKLIYSKNASWWRETIIFGFIYLFNFRHQYYLFIVKQETIRMNKAQLPKNSSSNFKSFHHDESDIASISITVNLLLLQYQNSILSIIIITDRLLLLYHSIFSKKDHQ